jgi:hypothetical protein
MKVKLKDGSIFGRIELTIITENMDEVYGLLATLNVRTSARLKDFPEGLGLDIPAQEKALKSIEMPLWNSVSQLHRKLEKAYNEDISRTN